MAETTPPGRRRLNLLKAIGFPLFSSRWWRSALCCATPSGGLSALPTAYGNGCRSGAPAAPLVYVAIQVLQVFVFVIPGDTVQIAGGYLFGFWLGLLLTILGIAAGSSINFWLARALGRPLLERFFPKHQIDRLSAVANGSRAQVGFFLLFVIPGIPKDILCYIAGISPLKFPFFLTSRSWGACRAWWAARSWAAPRQSSSGPSR